MSFEYLEQQDAGRFSGTWQHDAVKGAIGEFNGTIVSCNHRGCMGTAIILSLNEDSHDRAIDIFEAVQRICAEEDEPLTLTGKTTQFEAFLHGMLDNSHSRRTACHWNVSLSAEES